MWLKRELGNWKVKLKKLTKMHATETKRWKAPKKELKKNEDKIIGNPAW